MRPYFVGASQVGVEPVPYPLNLIRGGKLGDLISASLLVPTPMSTVSGVMNSARMQVGVSPISPVLSTTFLVVLAGAYSGGRMSVVASKFSLRGLEYDMVLQLQRAISVGILRTTAQSFGSASYG